MKSVCLHNRFDFVRLCDLKYHFSGGLHIGSDVKINGKCLSEQLGQILSKFTALRYNTDVIAVEAVTE